MFNFHHFHEKIRPFLRQVNFYGFLHTQIFKTLWHFKEIVYSGWEISLRIWVIATHELYSLRGLLQYVIQYLSLRSFSCLFIKQRPLYSPIKSSVKWGILNIMQICTLPCIISHLCICIIEIGGAVFSSTQELLYVTKVMC